jgi:hypothetical protein
VCCKLHIDEFAASHDNNSIDGYIIAVGNPTGANSDPCATYRNAVASDSDARSTNRNTVASDGDLTSNRGARADSDVGPSSL